jgi:hypothetical protein
MSQPSKAPLDRPVIVMGSGRCGSTLLQSILNSNPDFAIWGEHNGFLRHVAEAYYGARHTYFPDQDALSASARIERLRDPSRWIAWDNLCDREGFRGRFQAFIRSFFADPAGKVHRWGFKEIRYPRNADDQCLRLMADCFPETRFVILAREPGATVFSMVSKALAQTEQPDLGSPGLDQTILAHAAGWNARYMQLAAFCEAHASHCIHIRYEDLPRSETYPKLAGFLEATGFTYKAHLKSVRDPSDKKSPAAAALRKRMEALEAQFSEITQPARMRYGYADPAN